ncbi:hypothetical protein [Pedobacter agri]|uniref:hypothetical protein n=1 Tax=Pedobacter agri TaxID=454586 RepID=UPI00292FE36C|nr:hypothetical protein [Pedobacter agri]
MKKLVLFAAILTVSLFSINSANAQVSLNINIGQQPVWGPTGYDHVDYYYFPDIEAYYNIPSGQYIYSNGGRWVWVNNLPSQYRNFNLYNAYKVVVNEPKPYLRNNVYVAKYSKFKNYNGRQALIKDSRDSKYYVVKGHPNYNVKNNNSRVIQVVRPQNNNRPARQQGNVNRPNQQAKPGQSNNRGNDMKAGNNRPDRNNGKSRG